MTTTPALARAAEEFERLDDRHGLLYPEHALLVPEVTKRLVSAALHDPDDPDWLARVIDPGAFDFPEECAGEIEVARNAAAEIVAAILGEDA